MLAAYYSRGIATCPGAALLMVVVIWIPSVRILACQEVVDQKSAAAPSSKSIAVTALAISPDQKFTCDGSSAGVFIRANDGPGGYALPTKLDQVNAIQFSPDGETLAIGGGSPAVRGGIELWSLSDRSMKLELVGHDDIVTDFAWHPSERKLISA